MSRHTLSRVLRSELREVAEKLVAEGGMVLSLDEIADALGTLVSAYLRCSRVCSRASFPVVVSRTTTSRTKQAGEGGNSLVSRL